MTRPAMLWARVRESLWFVPSVLTAGATLLAFSTVWLDRHAVLGGRTYWFVFASGAEGARGVLATIAGSIITVTGVVFSITIVVLQLASSQFTPRVLRSFTENRANQLVLGVFIGTFTYSLLVLRTVRSETDGAELFVPALSVTIALALALVSIGFLIFFINHIARSIQAEVIIDRVTADAVEVVDALFPATIGEPASELTRLHTLPPEADVGWSPIPAPSAGYVQAVDEEAIMALAEKHDVALKMESRVGEFLIEGDPVATVSRPLPRDAAGAIQSAFQLGPERTRHQDVERGLIELSDIAVRALSPGINDPTTACVCIDRLTQILTLLSERRFPDTVRMDKAGRVRLIARLPTFEGLVKLAYSQIRHFGVSNPAIASRLNESLTRLAARVQPVQRAAVESELAELIRPRTAR